jgi:Rrf2 family cysteine metabolism transcriptional repressor
MKLTSRTEYALLALIHLTRANSDNYLPADVIAETQDIPYKYLEQILLALNRGRFLKSAKGPGGGYKLSKPASEITVAEIIRLFDGPLAPNGSASRYFYEETPLSKEEKLVSVLKEIRNFAADKLENTTLADIS